jgi:WD40 repeat protein
MQFSEKEKAFFEVYLKALKNFHKDIHKLNLYLEFKAMELGIEDLKGVLEKFNEFLREYLFFQSKREYLKSILPVEDDIVEILKENPYFVEYTVGFTFPSKAKYKGFKYKEPFIIARGNDGLVRIWKFDGENIHFIKELGETGAGEGAYEVWEDYLFYAKKNYLVVYHFESGKKIAEINVGSEIKALKVDEDGKVYLYKQIGNMAIKQNVYVEEGKIIFGPADPVAVTEVDNGEQNVQILGNKLLKLRNGNLEIFLGTRTKEKVELKPVGRLKPFDTVNDLLPYKEYVVVATTGHHPVVLDIRTGRKVADLEIQTTHSYRIVKNDAKKLLAIAHSENLISVWDLNTFQPIKILESYFIDVTDIDFSPDGKYLAGVGEGRDINVWDTETWEMIQDIDLPVEGVITVKFSPDGKYLATGCGDNKIYIISTEDWTIKNTLELHEGLISALVFTPDGKRLISGSWDGKVVIWNLENYELEKILETSSERIWRLDLSHDGKLMVVGGWDGRVHIYRISDWELTDTFPGKEPVMAVRFSDKYFVIGRKNGMVEVIGIEIKEVLDESSIIKISKDPSETALGISVFDGNIIAYTDKAYIRAWNNKGEKVFSAKVEGELKETENLREPNFLIKILPDTFILQKENKYFGGINWETYIQILKGNEIITNKHDFLKEITEPSLIREI